jgi:hypothetical protein
MDSAAVCAAMQLSHLVSQQPTEAQLMQVSRSGCALAAPTQHSWQAHHGTA